MIRSAVLLWLLYLSVGGIVLLLARWLARPIPARWALGLLLLPVGFCTPGFFAGRTLLPTDHVGLFPPWSCAATGPPRNANLNDAVTQMAPWAKAVRLAWKEGSLPLRDRWNGCGMPLAANSQSAAFSPLNTLTMALPIAHAFTLLAAARLFLALTGMWLWLRELGLRREAALFGAVAFAFSLTMTPWILFPLSGVFCLWPWALFAVELARDPRLRVRAVALLTVILAEWILEGHPESAVLGALGIVLFLAVRLFLREPGIARSLPLFVLAGGLAVALTAFAWLPELEAVRASNRYPQAERFRANLPVSWTPHLPGWRYGLLTSLFPRTLGDDVASPRLAGAGGSFSEMALGYFGTVGWAAVLLVLRPGSPRPRAEVALLALLSCGLAAGTLTWPFFDFFLSLPLVRLMLPLRLLSWVALSGAAVAAFEIDRLRSDRREDRGPLISWLGPPVLLAAAAVAVFLHFRPLHTAAGGDGSQRSALALCLAALSATAGLLLISRSSERAAAGAVLLLAGVSGAELFVQGGSLYRWGEPRQIFPQTPLVRFLRSRTGSFRVLGEGAALFPGTNIFSGVEEIRTHDPVERLDYVQFLDRACGYEPEAYFKHVRDTSAPVLDFLNVRFLVSGDPKRPEEGRWRRVYSGSDGTVLENPNVLPRVFSPSRVRLVLRQGASDIALPAGSWREEATISGLPGLAAAAPEAALNVPAEVSNYRESTNAVRFDARPVSDEGESFLVTSLVEDGGWRATDERGARIATGRANGVFLSLRLERGRHQVRLDYAPPGFRQGALCSGITLVAIAGFGRGWRMKRRES